jgi:maltooligosyltrehalose trehalohydrolase
VARALADRFVYNGRWSPHRRRRHGAPAGDVPADRFVICTQNHDQVGNRATGDRLASQITAPQARLAASLLLLAPYVPLLFMGQEYGETNPFQYFVSHGDEGLIAAVREGRRGEFASFAWQGEVPDPAAPETFRRSILDHTRAGEGEHARLRALYRELLHLRRREPALRPGDAEVRVEHDGGEGWITMRLEPARGQGSGQGGATLLALFNLSDRERCVPIPGAARGWLPILATEEARFGGGGQHFRIARGSTAGGGAPVDHVIVARHAAELYTTREVA